MNSFLSEKELSEIGFLKIGKNVKISRKASFYGASRIEIGDNSRIDDFCILSCGDKGIKIGKFVHISCYVSLVGKERIEFGDMSTISSHSSIFTSSDDFSGNSLTNPTIPEKYKKVDYRPVIIGKHVAIGSHSCILPGVTIGDGCSIGSCSLVKNNIEPGMIAAGVPCKVIKERNKNYLVLEKEFLKEAGY